MKTTDFRKREKDLPHGMMEIKLTSWSDFMNYMDYVHHSTKSNRQYIWRGQHQSDWRLQSSLQRKLFSYFDHKDLRPHLKKKTGENADHFLLMNFLGPDENPVTEHLEAFKLALRGRRGHNPAPLSSDSDWWALGQHYGLLTPLLDWTGSPFVACFFAFQKSMPSSTGERTIFGLWENDIRKAGVRLTEEYEKKKRKNTSRPQVIEFIRPFSDENARLVNQRGLFSKSPILYDIESWMTEFLPENHLSHSLVKITLPDTIRDEVLRSLNRMNINSLSLFPDISGAADYCNQSLLNYGYQSA